MKENDYASALMRSIENGLKPHEALKRLVEVMTSRGAEKLLPKVARSLKKQALENKSHSVELRIARKDDELSAKKAAHEEIAALGVKAADVDVVEDRSLVGGWELKGRGVRVDASYKKHLIDMYRSSLKAAQEK